MIAAAPKPYKADSHRSPGIQVQHSSPLVAAFVRGRIDRQRTARQLFRQLLSRQHDPEPGDLEQLASVADQLGLSPAEVEQHALAFEELCGIRSHADGRVCGVDTSASPAEARLLCRFPLLGD